MKLKVDPVRDAEIIAQRLGEAIPEAADEALSLASAFTQHWLAAGINPSDLVNVLRTLADSIQQSTPPA